MIFFIVLIVVTSSSLRTALLIGLQSLFRVSLLLSVIFLLAFLVDKLFLQLPHRLRILMLTCPSLIIWIPLTVLLLLVVIVSALRLWNRR
ncbi:hypothetical protein [Microviridae Fen685_11]|uniref:hypothetical protein n=1 Tax=Microviridae Fen685_11 TaxID=1655657 RepID=UPI00063D5C89|nr:hypothetical protein [Microviridae Fen685_11]AKI26928.1 hypothetical protein [Microviridae Fen685_11]